MSVSENCRAVITIKKSKFICSVFLCEREEQAKEQIARVRSEFKDATHHVYAYLAGGAEKYSDDKEPQGSAGLPVMSVLKKKNLSRVCAVVTRYFGGIKLGASGLAGAYAASVAAALEKAGVSRYELCGIWNWEIPYDMLSGAKALLKEENIIAIEYREKASVTAKLPAGADGEYLLSKTYRGVKIKDSYEKTEGEEK